MAKKKALNNPEIEAIEEETPAIPPYLAANPPAEVKPAPVQSSVPAGPPPIEMETEDGKKISFAPTKSGKYSLIDDVGDIYDVVPERVDILLKEGYRLATPEEVKHYDNVLKYDNFAGQMGAAGVGYAEGLLPFSTGNRVLEDLGVSKEYQEGTRSVNPGFNALGQAGGFLTLSYATAGLGSVVAGTRAGARVVQGIDAAAKIINATKPAQQALKLTNAAKGMVNGSKALSGISQIAKSGAALVPESMIAGASEELTDSFLNDKEVSAEAVLSRALEYSAIGAGLGSGAKVIGMGSKAIGVTGKEYLGKLAKSIPEENRSAQGVLKFFTGVDDDAYNRIMNNKEAVQNAKDLDVLGREVVDQAEHLYQVNHQKLDWAEEAIGDSLMSSSEVIEKLQNQINALKPHKNVAGHQQAIDIIQGSIDNIIARGDGTNVIDGQFLRNELVKQRQAGGIYSSPRSPHYNKFMNTEYDKLTKNISDSLKNEFKEYGERMKEVAPGFQLYKELEQVAWVNTNRVSAAEDNAKLITKAFMKETDPAFKRTLKKVNDFNMSNPYKRVDDLGMEQIVNSSNIVEDILNRRAKDSLQNSFTQFAEKTLSKLVGVTTEIVMPGPAFIGYIVGKEIGERVLTKYTPQIQNMTLDLMRKLDKKVLKETGETLTSKNIENSFIFTPKATANTADGKNAMMEFLNKRGYKAFSIDDAAGLPENSIAVVNVNPNKIEELKNLTEWSMKKQSGKSPDLYHFSGEKAGQKASPEDLQYFSGKQSKNFKNDDHLAESIEYNEIKDAIDQSIDATEKAYKSYQAGMDAVDIGINPTITLVNKIKSGINEVLSTQKVEATATKVLGKEDLELNQEKLFLKNKEAIMERVENPTKMVNEIEQSILNGGKDMSNTQVGAGVGEMKRIQYLHQLLPRNKSGGIYQDVPPTREQMRKFNQMVGLSTDPAKSLHLINNGLITQEIAQMVSTLYPGTYRMISQMLLEAAKESNKLIPYHKRLGISIFTGVPVGVDLTPDYLASSPKTIPPQQAGGVQGQMKPKMEIKPQLSTSAQKVEGGINE